MSAGPEPDQNRASSEHSSAIASTASSPAADDEIAKVKTRRRPVPGKGHRKSRKGCFNCKRRRVKCSEDTPRCYHCRRIGLVCEYPAAVATKLAPQSNSTALRATPNVLSMEDLRFFHHFLVTAYPPLPYGVDGVWQDVAAMAYDVCWLVHGPGPESKLLTCHEVRLPGSCDARPGCPASDAVQRS
jgi:hypothetical protein